jgi:metallophosphoesterase superfamily enzyme
MTMMVKFRLGVSSLERLEDIFAVPKTRFFFEHGGQTLHDHAAGKLPTSLGLDACLPCLDEPPFHFVHEPATGVAASARDLFTVAGHLHPTIAIQSPSGDRLADRCFVAQPSVLVLPAFGSFTGGHRVEPTEGMRLWIARDDGVADVTRLVAANAKRG